MGVDIIFKIAAIGVLLSVVNQVLKYAGKDEIATLTTLSPLFNLIIVTPIVLRPCIRISFTGILTIIPSFYIFHTFIHKLKIFISSSQFFFLMFKMVSY